jgi:hypothetical protein
MSAVAVLEQRSVAVEPGGEAVVTIRVRNTGRVVDQFALQVLGDPSGWAAVEPPTLSLFPGAEETATIRFAPPRISTVAAGERPFGVRVVSREDPEGVAVEEGSVVVGAFRQTSAELVPRNSRGSYAATHELAVDNNGNVPVEVFVRGTDPDAALTFRNRPPSLSIGPGRAGFVRVRVTARSLFLSGPARSHPFQLQVGSADQPPITVDGTMAQSPLVNSVVRNVAVAALLALVGAVLLWQFVLKPAAESAARSAVATPLAQQSSAIAALQHQVSSGGGGGGQTPRPGGSTPTPVPTAGGGSGTGGSASGQSFAHRLDQSGGGRNQYRVPAGTTVSITDLVFQNPGGDHGTVQLQRNGTTLLVENLDDFRDLDYHFVSPITLSANETIDLAVQCSNGCPSAAVYLNGTERPT